MKSPEGKRKISNELVPILAEITNQVIKAHYVKKLAQVLKVGEEAVIAEMEKAGYKLEQAGKQEIRREIKERTGKNRQERLTEYTLALVLQIESEVGRLAGRVNKKFLAEGAVKKVIEKLKDWSKSKKKWGINKFVESLPAELVGEVDVAYLTDLGKLSGDVDRLEIEFDKTMVELKKFALRKKMKQLVDKIKEAELKKDKKKLARLQKQFIEVGRSLKI